MVGGVAALRGAKGEGGGTGARRAGLALVCSAHFAARGEESGAEGGTVGVREREEAAEANEALGVYAR